MKSVASQPMAAVVPVNATCPIMGGDVDPQGEVAVYQGETIAFCCEGCKPKWESWSDANKASFVAAARQQ